MLRFAHECAALDVALMTVETVFYAPTPKTGRGILKQSGDL